MEIVIKDRDNNDVLSPTVTQWDQGVPIMIRDFLYPLDNQYPYLHFYNTTKSHIYAVGTQTSGNKLVVDSINHTLTCEIPNQLLMEPYPITVHVYIMGGGAATSVDSHVEAMTVFTGTISIETRMRPDAYEENDNAGELSSRYMQELFADEMDALRDELAYFYGTKPTPTTTACYYDSTAGKMYENREVTTTVDPATGIEVVTYTYSNEITGTAGVIYQDAATYVIYFYNPNGTNHWVEWSVSGAIEYAMERADACEQTADDTVTAYNNALNAKETALNAAFSAALDGCVIRVANTIPSQSDYENEDGPVITFVIGA